MPHIERDVRGEYLAPDVTPPDPTIDAYCDECGEEILSSETGYRVDEETNLCGCCYENYSDDLQLARKTRAIEEFNHDYREV